MIEQAISAERSGAAAAPESLPAFEFIVSGLLLGTLRFDSALHTCMGPNEAAHAEDDPSLRVDVQTGALALVKELSLPQDVAVAASALNPSHPCPPRSTRLAR
jgi:hypothetical protein